MGLSVRLKSAGSGLLRQAPHKRVKQGTLRTAARESAVLTLEVEPCMGKRDPREPRGLAWAKGSAANAAWGCPYHSHLPGPAARGML